MFVYTQQIWKKTSFPEKKLPSVMLNKSYSNYVLYRQCIYKYITECDVIILWTLSYWPVDENSTCPNRYLSFTCKCILKNKFGCPRDKYNIIFTVWFGHLLVPGNRTTFNIVSAYHLNFVMILKGTFKKSIFNSNLQKKKHVLFYTLSRTMQLYSVN